MVRQSIVISIFAPHLAVLNAIAITISGLECPYIAFPLWSFYSALIRGRWGTAWVALPNGRAPREQCLAFCGSPVIMERAQKRISVGEVTHSSKAARVITSQVVA